MRIYRPDYEAGTIAEKDAEGLELEFSFGWFYSWTGAAQSLLAWQAGVRDVGACYSHWKASLPWYEREWLDAPPNRAFE